MKKIPKILSILILLFCIAFLAFVAFKVTLGEVLWSKSQMSYTIPSHKTSLDPRTELHVQVTSGNNLLLKGKDVWIVAPDSKDTIAYGDTLYFYDIKKQVVSVYGEDKNGETIDKEVSADAVEGIKLHKDGIVLTSKKARIFALAGKQNHKLTFHNISDNPLTFKVQEVFR